MPRRAASRAIAARSSSEISAPVGLHGELRMMPRVRARDRVENRSGSDGEAVFRHRAHEDRRRLGELHLLGQRRPVRRVRDDLVAGIEQRERGVEERLLAAGAGDDFVFLVVDAVVRAVAIADRPLQLGDPADRRVLGEVVIDRVVRRGVDRLWRAEIGFAGAEVDHLDALAAQAVDDRRHFHRRRARNTAGAIGQAGRHCFFRRPSSEAPTFACRRSSTMSGTSPCTRPPSENTSLMSRELM